MDVTIAQSGVCDVSFYENMIVGLGILVAILGVLVAILIGWQIYQAVSFNKRLNRNLIEAKKEIRRSEYQSRQNITNTIKRDTDDMMTTVSAMIGKSMLDASNFEVALNFFLLAASAVVETTRNEDKYSLFTKYIERCIDQLLNDNAYEMDIDIQRDFLSRLRKLEGEHYSVEILMGKLLSIKTKEIKN